jgi:5-methylthioadenosine/S-adenosylhomocysteine deaminase
MDRWEPGTEMIGQTTEEALASVRALIERWHLADGGRLDVALSPRGPRNATPELWRACVALAQEAGLVLHTHVNENAEQAARLSREPGGRDVYALDSYGALAPNLVMAHAVWLEEGEQRLVEEKGAHVCHCPSSNLKLASGVAPIPEYLAAGINVALGADGAPCNNNLSALTEMRLAGLIHKPRLGPRTLPAEEILRLATMGGARALGLADEIGSLEVGKRADLVVLRRDAPHCRPLQGGSLASAVVYAHQDRDVSDVVVDGRPVVADGRLVSGSVEDIVFAAEVQRGALVARAGIEGLEGIDVTSTSPGQ